MAKAIQVRMPRGRFRKGNTLRRGARRVMWEGWQYIYTAVPKGGK